MKKMSIIALLLIIFSCRTNPLAGEDTLNFMPDNKVSPMALNQYSIFSQSSKVIIDTNDAQMVKRAGERIAKAVKLWLDTNGYKGYLDDYKWKYNLVDSPGANTRCMPGGKIVAYTGILPITKNEVELVVVMGHKVVHASANRRVQRMSAGILQQIGAVTGSSALQGNKYAECTDQFTMAYSLGSDLGVILPFSRSNGTEASAIGIQTVTIAGYNLSEVPELWKRMNAKKDGANTSDLLNTHPSNESRIKNPIQLVPRARAETAKFGATSFK